jgi:anti-sigma regulatory factor (Ser/Thr protein kinase)
MMPFSQVVERVMRGQWLRRPKGATAVVFVHGLLSDGMDGWRHAGGAYWPQLVADVPQLADVGIYVFTYETDAFSANYRLGDVVDALKEHMRLDDVSDSKRLIFVCHSMGGIVVRKYVVERVTDLIARDIEVDLFLIASPSLGSSYATWLSPIAQVLGHAQLDALRFTQRNAWLNDLDKEFQNLKESGKLRLRGKELVEDKSVVLKRLWRNQIVAPFSGARYFGESLKIPNSDHFSIAKPESAEAFQHRLLVAFILDVLRSDATHTAGAPLRVAQSVNEASEIRSREYDSWYEALSTGALNVVLASSAAIDANILASILSKVLGEQRFSQAIAANALAVFRELLANVVRHVDGREVAIGIELNMRHLPVIVLSVGDEGPGYDLWDTVRRQYLQMRDNGREHGVGRVCRLVDQVLPRELSSPRRFFALRCTLYDISWPGCLCDGYAWCEKAILDYGPIPSVWFGRRRYPLWWHLHEDGDQVWLKEWAALGTLDFALDNDIPQLRELYLEHLTSSLPHLFFEIRGHGGTEVGEPRTSAETIAQTLEKHFAEHFGAKRVLLYASNNAYTHTLKRLSATYDVPLYVTEEKCRSALRRLNRDRDYGKDVT